MNSSSLSQFALLIVAVAIIFTYIQPAFADIKLLQDERAEYQDAKDKAADFNMQLNALLAQVQSFRRADVAALETYLPNQIDVVATMADIETIARRNNVQITELVAAETVNPNEGVLLDDEEAQLPNVSFQDFEMKLSGGYENVKAMLRDIERNKYLLEIVRMQFGLTEDSVSSSVSNTAGGQGVYDVTLRAYAFSLTSDTEVVAE